MVEIRARGNIQLLRRQGVPEAAIRVLPKQAFVREKFSPASGRQQTFIAVDKRLLTPFISIVGGRNIKRVAGGVIVRRFNPEFVPKRIVAGPAGPAETFAFPREREIPTRPVSREELIAALPGPTTIRQIEETKRRKSLIPTILETAKAEGFGRRPPVPITEQAVAFQRSISELEQAGFVSSLEAGRLEKEAELLNTRTRNLNVLLADPVKARLASTEKKIEAHKRDIDRFESRVEQATGRRAANIVEADRLRREAEALKARVKGERQARIQRFEPTVPAGVAFVGERVVGVRPVGAEAARKAQEVLGVPKPLRIVPVTPLTPALQAGEAALGVGEFAGAAFTKEFVEAAERRVGREFKLGPIRKEELIGVGGFAGEFGVVLGAVRGPRFVKATKAQLKDIPRIVPDIPTPQAISRVAERKIESQFLPKRIKIEKPFVTKVKEAAALKVKKVPTGKELVEATKIKTGLLKLPKQFRIEKPFAVKVKEAIAFKPKPIPTRKEIVEAVKLKTRLLKLPKKFRIEKPFTVKVKEAVTFKVKEIPTRRELTEAIKLKTGLLKLPKRIKIAKQIPITERIRIDLKPTLARVPTTKELTEAIKLKTGLLKLPKRLKVKLKPVPITERIRIDLKPTLARVPTTKEVAEAIKLKTGILQLPKRIALTPKQVDLGPFKPLAKQATKATQVVQIEKVTPPILKAKDFLLPGSALALGLRAGVKIERLEVAKTDVELIAQPTITISKLKAVTVPKIKPLAAIEDRKILGVAALAPILKAAVRSKVSSVTVPRIRDIAIVRERLKLEERLRVAPISVPRIDIAPRIRFAEAEKFGEIRLPRLRELEKVKEEEKPRIRPPDVRVSVKGSLARLQREFAKGFVLEVKRKGKFVPTFPGKVFTEKGAKQLAQQLVGGTPLATFRITPAVGRLTRVAGFPEFKPEQFRFPRRAGVPQPRLGTFVELRKFRIDKPGELKGITRKGLLTLATFPELRKRKRRKKTKRRRR